MLTRARAHNSPPHCGCRDSRAATPLAVSGCRGWASIAPKATISRGVTFWLIVPSVRPRSMIRCTARWTWSRTARVSGTVTGSPPCSGITSSLRWVIAAPVPGPEPVSGPQYIRWMQEHGHRVLKVCGKGSKAALVPLPPSVGLAIDRAISARLAGPILRNTCAARTDRHAATRRLRRLAEEAWPSPQRPSASPALRAAWRAFLTGSPTAWSRHL